MHQPRGHAGLPAKAEAEAQATAPLLGGGLSARLDRWAADVRVDDAAHRRVRERWLRQQAEEGGTLAGVLADLAERGTPLAVRTHGARHHRGRVQTVGADFVALAIPDAGDVVVALAEVSSVRPQPGQQATTTTGDRPPRTSLRLTDVLAVLAAERERALLIMFGAQDAIGGRVQAVGQDVITVRTEGPEATTAYLPVGAIGEIVLGL